MIESCRTCGSEIEPESSRCGRCGAELANVGEGPRSRTVEDPEWLAEVAWQSVDPALAVMAPGTLIGRFRIEDILGRGGMGVVYRAFDPSFERRVALKVVAPELAQDPELRARFKAESLAAAAIEHPHILPVYQTDEVEGNLLIAMRLVEGPDLRELLRRERRLSPERTLAVIGQLAAALDAAYEKGLVHRDVKPANVLIARASGREHAYLCDFGLARRRLAATAGLTRRGAVVGTAAYMSPEQVRGLDLDGRSDLYALACVAYECLAGRPPFLKDTEDALMWAHVNEAPPSLRSAAGPEVPGLEAFDRPLSRALKKDPGRRFVSCAELAAAMESAASAPAPRRARAQLRTGRSQARQLPRPWIALGAVAVAGLAVALALLFLGGDASLARRSLELAERTRALRNGVVALRERLDGGERLRARAGLRRWAAEARSIAGAAAALTSSRDGDGAVADAARQVQGASEIYGRVAADLGKESRGSPSASDLATAGRLIGRGDGALARAYGSTARVDTATGRAVRATAAVRAPGIRLLEEVRLPAGAEETRGPGRSGTGTSVRPAGDVNGDGLDDVVVTAQSVGSSPGGEYEGGRRSRAWVLYGGRPALSHLGARVTRSRGFEVVAPREAYFGDAAGVGDANGDGLDDVAFGLQGAVGAAGSKTYVVLGSSSLQRPTVRLDSAIADVGRSVDFAGDMVQPAGDVNGDGLADMIVGAVVNMSGPLYFVVFGTRVRAPATLLGPELKGNGFAIRGTTAAGSVAIAGDGDVNGDGLADVVVARAGRQPDQTNDGRRSDRPMLSVLLGRRDARDVDLDDRGAALREIRGVSAGRQRRGELGPGLSVALVPAAGRDARSDIVVGSPSADTVYVIFGSAGSRPLDVGEEGNWGYRVNGTGGSFGEVVESAGDVNGDGRGDIIVGVPFAQGLGLARGEVHVIYGRRETSRFSANQSPRLTWIIRNGGLDEARSDSAFALGALGSAVAGADVDGNGRSDLIVGVGRARKGAGAVYFLLS